MRLAVTAVAVLLALLACGEDEPRSASDVEAAIHVYLSKRTDLRVDEMRVRADRIRYDGDRAVASVSIMASDDPKAIMKMMYELVRESDGWRVVPPESAVPPATAPVEGEGLPPGHPPTGGLPPGHPPTAPQGGGLPPGHPPISGEER